MPSRHSAQQKVADKVERGELPVGRPVKVSTRAGSGALHFACARMLEVERLDHEEHLKPAARLPCFSLLLLPLGVALVLVATAIFYRP
jgi:hypothetical protein